MSFTFTVMTVLLGSSAVIAFVLQPAKEEPAASANSPVSHHRCNGGSLQSIRKGLLSSLNMQVEPQLPAGGLDHIREQWRSTFRNAAPRGMDTAVPAVSGYSVSPDGGNSTGMRCCSLVSEVLMKDLGWDNWMIYPESLTIVQCVLCDPEANAVQCPTSHSSAPDATAQVPCCQPTAQKMVPVVYVNEFSTVFISSVQMTSGCGCGHGNIHQPTEE